MIKFLLTARGTFLSLSREKTSVQRARTASRYSPTRQSTRILPRTDQVPHWAKESTTQRAIEKDIDHTQLRALKKYRFSNRTTLHRSNVDQPYLRQPNIYRAVVISYTKFIVQWFPSSFGNLTTYYLEVLIQEVQ